MPVNFFKNASNNNEPNPTFEQVYDAANALFKDSKPDEINSVLKQIASGGFETIAFEQLLGMVQSKTKLPKKQLRQTVKTFAHQMGLSPGDPAIDLAKKVLNLHFAGSAHLLRNPDGSFHKFIGTHWVPTNDGALRKLVQETASKYFALHENLPALINNGWVSLRDMLGNDVDLLNQEDTGLPVVNCLNGEVWIEKNGAFGISDHKAESALTYCLPFEYDSTATCPRFDQALFEIFTASSDPEAMARHWCEFLGYTIHPDRPFPSFWLLIGSGANGKSFLLKILQALLGPDATQNDNIAKFMRDRFNLAYLEGKLALIDDDLSEDTVLDDGLIKAISEPKKISARRAYGKTKRDFIVRALPIMAGNHYPLTNDVSHGLLRRAQVIPFNRKFEKEAQDHQLFEYIFKNEMPGVLNRALSGLQELLLRDGFDPPTDCLDAADEFLKHASPLMAFIDEQCVHDPEGRTRLMDFRHAMKVWAIEQGVKKPAGADKTLKQKLKGLGYTVENVKGYATVYGLTLDAQSLTF